MTSTFEFKWHTKPAVGLAFYDGVKRLSVNHNPRTEDPLPIAINRLRHELRRTFPAHEIIVDEALQVAT